MPRCFIAVRVPPSDALRQVLRDLGRMGRAVRPVQPDDLHVTLRFLGEVKQAALSNLADAMTAAAADVRPFEARVSHLGAYPDIRRPRIVWADAAPPHAFEQIVTRLADPLEALGFPADARPWQAHVTLARIKARPPAELAVLLSRPAETDLAIFPVSEIELITSELTRRGPIYRTAARRLLGRP